MNAPMILYCIGLVCCLRQATATNYTHVQKLFEDVLLGYNSAIRPVLNQSDITYVSHEFYLKLLTFDDVNSEMTTSFVYIATWTDELIQWNPKDYGGTIDFKIPLEKVWYPNLFIGNGADGFAAIQEGVRNHFVQFLFNGTAYLTTVIFSKTTCNPNVALYPFDSHTCSLQLATFGYPSNELINNLNREYVSLDYYTENTLWEVETVPIYKHMLYGYDVMEVPLMLSRRPLFLIINLLTPVTCLAILTLFVFVLPPSSGEKASYAITVFLAFAVFITIIMDKIPLVATQTPVLSFIVLLQLANNAIVCVSSVFSIHYYHKDITDPIPFRLQCLARVMNLRIKYPCSCLNNRNKVDPDRVSTVQTTEEGAMKETSNTHKTEDLHEEHLTWPSISSAVNKAGLCCCIILTLSEIIITMYNMHSKV